MSEDIRNTEAAPDAQVGSGDGAAVRTGYGPGGLGAGGDRAHHGQDAAAPNTWDAPGVTPDGHRTGSSQEGPRIAHDGEAEPDAERWAGEQDENDG